MRVFMTSATGHVGEAVAEAFLGAGHEVAALTRSAEKAQALLRRGISPVQGNLRDPRTYGGAAAEHQIIVHTAFEYDEDVNEVHATDRTAVDALLQAAAASEHAIQFIYTSSAFLLGGISAERLDEATPTTAAHPRSSPRLQVEEMVLSGATKRLSTAVIRLGVVYGGRSFTMNELFSSAEREGRVAYVVNGESRWPMVYRNDLSALYVAVAEQRARGVFHAVDGSPLRVSQVAEIASRAAGCAGLTRHDPPELARDEAWSEHDERVDMDAPVVAIRSRELGWRPSVRSFQEGAAIAFREWRELRSTAS